MYSLGDRAKNTKASIIHIEGDPDHPVNRGTLCPKGAALLDFVHAKTRLRHPEYRAPGSDHPKSGGWPINLARRRRGIFAFCGWDQAGNEIGGGPS